MYVLHLSHEFHSTCNYYIWIGFKCCACWYLCKLLSKWLACVKPRRMLGVQHKLFEYKWGKRVCEEMLYEWEYCKLIVHVHGMWM